MKYAKMLEGRYALILGGSSGVSRAIADTFAAHGAKVAYAFDPVLEKIHSRDARVAYAVDSARNEFAVSDICVSHANNSMANEFATHDAQVAHASDSSQIIAFNTRMSPDSMPGLCTSVLAGFPYVDILVGATNAYKYGAAHDISANDLKHMLDVNLGCAVKCFQSLLPGMLKRRRGELVLLAPDCIDAAVPGAAGSAGAAVPGAAGSAGAAVPGAAGSAGAAVLGAAGSAGAAACAGAISSFARNVTNDYIRYRVRANTILYPFGGIHGKAPLSGSPEPQDAANAALWYACYMSRFVTGETLKVNGGLAYANVQNAAQRIT